MKVASQESLFVGAFDSSSTSGAVCGLPSGDPSLLRPAVMLNILGDLWSRGTPDWTPVLSPPQAHLHLYGKQRALPGRKMGHILVLGDNVEQASALAETIAAALERSASTQGVRHGAGRG